MSLSHEPWVKRKVNRRQNTGLSQPVRALLVMGATGVGLFLTSLARALGETDSTPLFLGVVAVCALRWSITEGLLSVAFSAVAIAVELRPQYQVRLAQGPVLVNLASFLSLSTLLLWLVRKSAGASEAVRATEQRFRVALLKSPVIVFHQDKDLRYVWVYHPFPEHEEASLMGKRDSDLFPPDEASRLTKLKQKALQTGVSVREEVPLTTQGEVHLLEVTVEPFRLHSGEIDGLLGTAVDVTEHKRRQERLRNSLEQLRSLAGHLTATQEKERAFASREIHDRISQILAALNIELSLIANQMSEGAAVEELLPRVNAVSEAL